MDEAKGPNPHFEGLHEGESDELRALRLALVKECRELRESLAAVSDALDYLHGMTPKQAADVRKDAGRYRWLRHGDNDERCIRLTSEGQPYMLRAELLDRCIDEAMADDADKAAHTVAAPAVGAA